MSIVSENGTNHDVKILHRRGNLYCIQTSFGPPFSTRGHLPCRPPAILAPPSMMIDGRSYRTLAPSYHYWAQLRLNTTLSYRFPCHLDSF